VVYVCATGRSDYSAAVFDTCLDVVTGPSITTHAWSLQQEVNAADVGPVFGRGRRSFVSGVVKPVSMPATLRSILSSGGSPHKS